MNYYPFHIGDYASATRHLSWDEDAAYRRLLDVYYTTELPLPLDLRAVCRLVLATTNAQREAVQTVLEEFFDEREMGWFHERCSAEIAEMQAKKSNQDDKNAHEAERMKRFRERRAVMFETLRQAGQVPAWDIPMKDLQRLVDATCNANGAVAGNADATAIPIPTPTPTPTPTPKNKEQREARKRATPIPPDFGISERVRTWAEAKGLNHLDQQLEAFVSYAKRKGATYVDWDEALMTAIRDDWAKARKGATVSPFAGAI